MSLRRLALPAYLVVLAVASSAWAARGIGQSLWRDEAATASASTRTLPQLVHLLGRQDPALAAYYVFMHAWTSLFGHSETALRVPSLIAVAAAVVMLGLLADRLAGPVAGVAAATLLVVVPDLVGTYAIQARPYGLVVAFVTGGALCAVHIARGRRSAGLYAAWSVLAALAIAFEVLAAPAVVAQLVWLVGDGGRSLDARRDRRRVVAAVILPVVTGIAALWMAHRGSSLQNWIPETSLHQIGISAIALVTVGGLVLVAASIPGLVLLARATRGTSHRTAALDLVAAACWAVLPFAALVVYSVAVAPSFISRYYLSAVPGASLVIALVVAGAVRGARAAGSRSAASGAAGSGATGSRDRRLPRAALALVVVASVVALGLPVARHQLGVVRNEDLRGTAAFIRARDRAGDGIVYSPTFAESGLRWYFGDGRSTATAATAEAATDAAPTDAVPTDLLAKPGASAIAAGSLWTPTALPGSRAASPAVALDGVDRVWVVGYSSFQDWTPVPDVGTPVAEAVERCWTPGAQRGGTVSVELWTRPAGPRAAGCDF